MTIRILKEQLSDIELDQEQIDKVYDYLESQGIDVVSNIELEEENPEDKELDLSIAENSINIDDHVRMLFKRNW